MFFNRHKVFFLPQVRDGPGETAPLFGKYCGSTLPAPIVSSANALWIRFKSDSSVSHAGFRGVYEISKTCFYTTETLKASMANLNAINHHCFTLDCMNGDRDILISVEKN